MSLTKDEFWALVEECRDKGVKCKLHLVAGLRKMALDELLWFNYWHSCAMHESYLKALHEYAERAFGECGDDSFIDFRDWLISQGREVFEYAVANPDRLDEYFPGKPNESDGPSRFGFMSSANGIISDRAHEAIVPEERLPPAIPEFVGYLDQPNTNA